MKVFILKEGRNTTRARVPGRRDAGRGGHARRMIHRKHRHRGHELLQTDAGKMISRYIEGTTASHPAAARIPPRNRCKPRSELAFVDFAFAFSFFPFPFPLLPLKLLPFTGGVRSLPDPRRHALHDRARHGLVALDGLRSRRQFRPPLRAGLGVADPEDDGGPGAGLRPRASGSVVQLRRRRESPEHLRYPDRVRVPAAATADRRQGFARAHSVSRVAPAADGASASRSHEPRVEA